jgi:PKD repeat protein
MKISGCTRRPVLAGVLLGALAAAPTASAVVVHDPNGQLLSVAPIKGVNPTSIPGSVAAQHAAAPLSSNGNLDYNGGPVVHSSAPYLIFWRPPGETIGSAATESLLQSYFIDTAADSGNSANIYGVNRQFTDATGFADYKQTFSSSTQSIVDTQAYPTSGNCTRTSTQHPTCVTDAQVKAEITRLIAANGLPTAGPTSASELNQNAPIYFVVLPADVNECSGGTSCSDNTFCAYHSVFNSGGQHILYSLIPTLLAATNPKSCQADGHSAVQKPNLDRVGDVAIKYMSHEDSETITDPLLNAWFDNASGNEDGDNCNFTGSFSPTTGDNPNAFTPTLGGSGAAGTLFNQSMNGDSYYIQSEWSNGDINCKLRPSAGTISASFSASSGPVVGTPVGFDPSASSSTNGYSSVTWDFGDGGTSFDRSGAGPNAVSHTYGAAGTYTVSLTLVDPKGRISRASQQVSVTTTTPPPPPPPPPGGGGGGGTPPPTGTGGTPPPTGGTQQPDEVPTAGFAIKSAYRGAGGAVKFDGSASRDPDGSIVAYAWNFGDGKVGSGATPSHAFGKPGAYTVTLGVMDSDGQTASTSWTVTVVKAKITAVKVKKKTKTGATIVVTVNAPGRLSGVGKPVRVTQAGVLKLKLLLTGAQQGTRASSGSLALHLNVRFAPSAGTASKQKLTIKF